MASWSASVSGRMRMFMDGSSRQCLGTGRPPSLADAKHPAIPTLKLIGDDDDFCSPALCSQVGKRRIDAFNQFVVADRKACSFTCSQQLIDRNLSPRLECQSQRIRSMTKVLRQELADCRQSAIHRSLPFVSAEKNRGDGWLHPHWFTQRPR